MTPRRLYTTLIGLHPRRFRERYGAEMLAIFDESGPGLRLWLLRDALQSLARQRFLRDPEEVAAPMEAGAVAGPVFVLIGEDRPSGGALRLGGAVNLFVWGALLALLSAGVSPRLTPRGLLGSGRGTARIAAAVAEGEATAAAMPATVADALFAYLDRNGDGGLSAAEISDASRVLQRLDADRDGRLQPAECGIRAYAVRSRVSWLAGSLLFDRLDRDGNGSLALLERAEAPMVLQRLDGNADGLVDLEEVR